MYVILLMTKNLKPNSTHSHDITTQFWKKFDIIVNVEMINVIVDEWTEQEFILGSAFLADVEEYVAAVSDLDFPSKWL